MIRLFPRLTLSQRILAVFCIGVVFSVAIVGQILVQLDKSATLSSNAAQIFAVVEDANELRIVNLRVILLLHQYRYSRDSTLLAEIKTARAEAAVHRMQLRTHTRLPDVVQSLDRLEALLPQRIAAFNAIRSGIESGASDREFAGATRHLDTLDREARAVLRRIASLERQEFERKLAHNEEAREALRRNALIGFALYLAIMLLLLYSMLFGKITHRLKQLTQMAHQIAAGDYSQKPFLKSGDEIAALANEFNRMAGQLAEFDKVKEEFVALASHQLRTPATAVKGNLGVLLEGYCGELTAEQIEIIRDANSSNERQLLIIEDLLWVARTDSGRLVITKTPTDMTRLAAEAVAEQTPVARQRRQTLTLERLTAVLMLNLDAQKIRMVIENLISNAIKYTPEGGRIHVGLTSTDGGAVITVSDTGVGIAPEDLTRLFNKFSRISNPLSETAGGTGLGLYLAKQIVKLHDGAIAVESQPGTGTTFRITLPK